MKKSTLVFWLIGIAVLITIFLMWSADHDKKVEEAAQTYENCVRVQFGVSPAQWYAEKGEYPECK